MEYRVFEFKRDDYDESLARIVAQGWEPLSIAWRDAPSYPGGLLLVLGQRPDPPRLDKL